MRAFLALNLDVSGTRRVAETTRPLHERTAQWPISWVPPTKYHVTLQFLGRVDVGLAPALGDLLRSLTQGAPALRLRLGGLDAFPNKTAARVLFVTVEDPLGALVSLARRVDVGLQELGFPPVEEPFVPHVTVARLRAPTDVQGMFADSGPPLGPVFGMETALYRSDVERPGAEYITLARHGFLAAAPAHSGPRPKGSGKHRGDPAGPRGENKGR